MLAEEPLKVGQAIDYEGDRYRVVGVYSRHVLLEDAKTKARRDVANADLMIAGVIKQKGEQFEGTKQIKNQEDAKYGAGFGVAKRWDKG